MAKGRIELLNLDNYRGVWDTKARKRLPHLFPNKYFNVKVKASAYEGGYTLMRSNDLFQKTRRLGRFISMKQYKQLKVQFPRIE